MDNSLFQFVTEYLNISLALKYFPMPLLLLLFLYTHVDHSVE